MSIEFIDESIATRLFAVSKPSELRAPDGRLVGQFIPAERKGKVSFPEFGMTDEELEARANRPDAKWYTADEVMSRLRELTKES